MNQDFKKLRWSAVLGLTVVATSGLLGACNSHPVEFAQATGAISVHETRSTDSAAVDILWVIDNSGSMCEEQGALRDNFREFITQISNQDIDFHIGVTTTHMKDNYALETVARPGYLQSMPQPVPTYIATCHGAVDDPEDPNDAMDGYKPIREALAVAIDDCTKDPSQWQHLKGVTDDEIACYLDQNCDGTFPHEMFPTGPDGQQPYSGMPAQDSPYREIPKVLKFSEYRNPDTGVLEEERLRKDFACMSLVGTRGYSIEKGLAAAVEAVSPAMTGGPAENPTDKTAPNHGFLRDAAKFSVIFVTDETDCSQSGQYEHYENQDKFEGTACYGEICAFANAPGLEKSPLIPPQDLADSLKQNLSASKGYDVEDDAIIAASIHGRWKRYGEDYPDGQALTPQDCKNLETTGERGEQTSCNTAFGTAFSGDRYERFLRQFNPDQVFPTIPSAPGAHMDGLICRPNEITNTLKSLGQKIAGSVSQCIYRVPHACDSSDQCPAFAFGDDTAECLPFGQKPGASYCNSGLQVRLYPGKGEGDKTFADLQNHEYCIPESIDSPMTPGGCVIKRDKYEFGACPGAPELAINMTWTDDRYFNSLSGYEVELVYTVLPEADDSSSNNGADAGN